MSKSAEKYIETALGGNLYMKTLKPKAFGEIMQSYSDQEKKAYHKEQMKKELEAIDIEFLKKEFPVSKESDTEENVQNLFYRAGAMHLRDHLLSKCG